MAHATGYFSYPREYGGLEPKLGQWSTMITFNSGECKVALSAERGAIVTSLEVHGKEILYLDRATFDDPSKNVRGGVPVLFPICGPLAEPSYQWEGAAYALKQHGFARNLAWTIMDRCKESVTLEISDSVDTRAHFPFAFRYQLRYVATASGLRIEQVIENRSMSSMPVAFGFHPYFLVGEKSGLCFDLPVTTYSDNKSEAAGPFPGFDFSNDEIDWAFPHPTARQAGFKDPSRGIEVTVEHGEVYQALVFWSLKGAPFVCLEPWSSSRLAFPHGPDVHHVGPGGALKTQVEIAARLL